MTTARTAALARATRRRIEQFVKVPDAVSGAVDRILDAQFEIHAAMEALALLTEPTSLAKAGYIGTAPPLTDQEWALLAEMMADGRLPLMHSFPELTRALLKLCEDKP